MSVTRPHNAGSMDRYGLAGVEHTRGPLPTLPSMSSLLRHEVESSEDHTSIAGRQLEPPYNMVRHPTWSYPSRHQLHSPRSPYSQSHTPSPTTTESHLDVRMQVPPTRQFRKITQRHPSPTDNSKQEDNRTASPSINDKDDSYSVDSRTYSRHGSGSSASSSSTMTPRSGGSRAMPISGLLSDVSPSAPPHRGPTYSIRMRQQPMAARACGFGERDRRVIDPPPILQMEVSDPTASPEQLRTYLRQLYAVVHCALWDPVKNCDGNKMPGTTDKRQQRRLMGTLVSSPFLGKDEHNNEGCFFTFPDLSVRTPGTYSLKFSLVVLDVARMTPNSREPIRCLAWSDEFHVFNAKDFAGMRPSTELTKTLKHQGCLISVKKGNIKTGAAIRSRDDDDDGEEDDDIEDNEEDREEESGKKKKLKRTKQ